MPSIDIEQSAAKALGIPFIDVVPWACSPDLCPVVINNIFVYFDQWHFTASVRYLVDPSVEEGSQSLAVPAARRPKTRESSSVGYRKLWSS
jgi:hypothetical protein